ncbi:MAG: retroviral-like aspartic protease family protein [Anaerolineae bacterium]
MIFRYSQDYDPAAPVVEIRLSSIAEDLQSRPLQALIDTGADGTIVPVAILDNIRAPSTTEMFIRSQWGESRRVLLYLVDVELGDLTVPGVEVVGDELSDEIVLGRDVINRVRVFLDGPKGMTTITL